MLPNQKFYTCPFCNNEISSQSKLLHEARCENQRLKESNYKTNHQNIAFFPQNQSNNNIAYSNNISSISPPPSSSQQFFPTFPQYISNNNNSNGAPSNMPNPPQNFINPNPYNSVGQIYHPPNVNVYGGPPAGGQIQINSFNRNNMPFSNTNLIENFSVCSYCEIRLPASIMELHYETCPNLITGCPICNEDFPVEIIQEHINESHKPPEGPQKRQSSPSFFDKIANIFKSDKKKNENLVNCKKCNNSIDKAIYQQHYQKCKIPRPNNARIPSLVFDPQNNRLFSMDNSGQRSMESRYEREERKKREFLFLIRLLMQNIPEKEQKKLTEKEIEEHTFLIKYDASKSSELNEEYKKCSICQCDFEDQEEVRIFVCLHRYHKECAEAWLKKKDRCPLCRNGCVGNNEIQESN